jgi:type II secretory pathway component PulC
MKDLRSNLNFKKILDEYPILIEYEQELTQMWQSAFHSMYTIWYAILMSFIMCFMAIMWMKDLYYTEQDYRLQLQSVEMKANKTSSISILQIGAERLFGEPLRTETQQAITNSFNLQGIIYHEQPSQRVAILKDAQGEVKFYHIGDSLSAGAVLEDIDEQQIIIKVGGFKQSIKLQQYPASFISDKPLNTDTHLLDDKTH